MIKRTSNREVRVTGVLDDIVYQDVIVSKTLKVFGITLWNNHIIESIVQNTKKLKKEVDESGVGFRATTKKS